MSIEQQFQALRRRQPIYGSFRVGSGGAVIDISLRIWRVGFRINRDHRSRKIYIKAA